MLTFLNCTYFTLLKLPEFDLLISDVSDVCVIPSQRGLGAAFLLETIRRTEAIEHVETLEENANNERSEQLGGSILTIRDVATILRCSKAQVSNILNGKIPKTPPLTHVAIGRRKLVRREWLEQWMEENKSE